MAKTATKKPAGARKRGTASAKQAAGSTKRPKPQRSRPAEARASSENGKSAADALLALLESPLVADLLAAGAAAALAAFTQHSFSRREDGGPKQALKRAGKAAAAAMGARISEELDEIRKSAKAAKREAR